MTEEEGDIAVSLFLYGGGRAPHDIVNARVDKSINALTDGAFCDCKALEYLELHDAVMTIEREAFHGCCSLRRIVMPSNHQVFDDLLFELTVDSFEKEMDIQQWLESVQSKIQHNRERNKLLEEAARISCGAYIEDNVPFPIQEKDEPLLTKSNSPRMVAQDELDDDNRRTCYGKDIYEYFRSKEADTDVTLTSTYMNGQPHINAAMRSILMDWLIEVNLKMKHVPATLYLIVNIVDRYLSKATVKRSELQLVGVTALFIASKYEEIYQCELEEMVLICDNAYTESEASVGQNQYLIICSHHPLNNFALIPAYFPSYLKVLDMERQILQTIEYQLIVPSAHFFLATYIEVDYANKSIEHLAHFILDGTLLSYVLLRYNPSKLASAAMLIARNTLGMCPWSATLANYAQYCEAEIRVVARAVLAEKGSTDPELNSVLEKYSKSAYGCVANIDIPGV